jgi:hypothetical protein
LALEIIGNSQIAGNVKITNPNAYVTLQGGQAGIGGVTGEEATQPPYTEYGAPPTEFPEMYPALFASYAPVENALPADTDTSADATFENLRIPGGMNPTFSGHATLKGVTYIETPNVVTFTGTVDIMGIIVGDGDQTDNSQENQITFGGSVNSWPVDQLPQEEQFLGLHEQVGTFAMAPGFFVRFGGGFDALCGAIAANGMEFYGNAGGTINGSLINYSDAPLTLSGNGDLYFNRSGLTEVPAGFVPEIVLHFLPSSYSEVL